MMIIGERINASRKSVREAVAGRDGGAIADVARRQVECGAAMLDVNAGGDPERETEDLVWLVGRVLEAVRAPLCLDSSSPETLRAGIEEVLRVVPEGAGGFGGGAPWVLVNSVSGEEERYSGILPLLKEYDVSVIGLCLGDEGMPESAEARVGAAVSLVERLAGDGVAEERIFLDPLVVPVGVNPAGGMDLLAAMRAIRERLPGVKLVCGLSNVSYGLPDRALLNRTFLAMAAAAGLGAVIADPLNEEMMKAIRASLALTGRDEFCAGYIRDYRRRTGG
ncbi:MAG: dihydropteroate synthase [bacterium]